MNSNTTRKEFQMSLGGNWFKEEISAIEQEF
jgi:hypothetical protein